MKITDVITEAASPAQQAAIAVAMKKAGKKPKQDVAEGSTDQYKAAFQAIQKLQSFAQDNPDFDLNQLDNLPSRGNPVKPMFVNADHAIDLIIQAYITKKEPGNAEFLKQLKNEINYFLSDRTASSDPTTLGDLLQGKLGKVNFQQGVAEGAGETLQQQKIRAAISNGLAKSSQMGKTEYQSQPTNRTYFDNAGYASDKLTGIDSIDPDGTVVISIGDTRAADWVKKLAALGGMPGIKTREVQPKLAQGVSEDLSEEFDLIESIVEMIAEHNGVDAEVVWADLESLTEDELYVFAVTSDPLMEDWQKANKRDKTDGMSQKAVNAYRRENPGSKLKTAVTTKPGKLKKGGKASKRRKSYCSRSRGQMKMHSISCAKTPDKAICKARRRWNC